MHLILINTILVFIKAYILIFFNLKIRKSEKIGNQFYKQKLINNELNKILLKFGKTPIEIPLDHQNVGELIFDRVTQSRKINKKKDITDEDSTLLITELLKLNCIDVNSIKSFLNQTLLHYASENNNLNLCKLLLNNGADCLIEDNYRQTPFTISSKSDNLKLVEIFCKFMKPNLKKDEENVNKLFKQIRNSISFACQTGNVKIVQYLLEEFNLKSEIFLIDKNVSSSFINKKKNINSLYLKFQTYNQSASFELNPIHVACFNANGKIVKLLLDRALNKEELINTPINDFRCSTTLEETFKGLLSLSSEEIQTNQYSVQIYRENISRNTQFHYVINLLIENRGKFSKNFVQNHGLSKLLAQTFVGHNKDIYFRHLLDKLCFLFKFKLNEILFYDEFWPSLKPNSTENNLHPANIKNKSDLTNETSEFKIDGTLFDMEKAIDEFLFKMFIISQRVIKDHKRACMNKYIELLFILHYSGQFKINISKMGYLKERNLAMYNFIGENVKTPMSLKWLSITQVRNSIQNFGINKINSLPIPCNLKQNLFLNGIPVIDKVQNNLFKYYF